MIEQAFERLHDARGEADVRRGDRDRDRERREDENEQDQYHGEEGRWELARGIAQLVDVDGVDLDPGVEEEAVDDQHEARSPCHAGSTWWAFSRAAEALPCRR